jgi:hypothetical protein
LAGYINLPKTPYIIPKPKVTPSYDPKAGVYINSQGEGMSIAPEKVGLIDSNFKVSSKGGSNSKKKKNKASSPEVITPPQPSQEIKSISPNVGVVTSRPINPSETLAKPVNIDTSGFLRTNTQGTYTSAPVMTPEEKRINLMKTNAQAFRESFITPSSNAPSGFEGLKQAGKTGGIAVGMFGVNALYGVKKGSVQAVKDIASGQIVTGTFETATELVSNPKKFGSDTFNAFKSNPPGFIGEQASYGYVSGKIIGYGASGKPVKTFKRIERRMSQTGEYTPLPSYTYQPVNLKENIIVLSSDEAYKQGRDFQSTLNGQIVSDSKLQDLGVITPKSPLGLDQTPFYNKGKARYYDIPVPEVTVQAQRTINTPEAKIIIPYNKVFPGRTIGATEDTSFYRMPIIYEAPTQSAPSILIRPQGFKTISKQKIPKNVLIAEEVPEVKIDIVKDTSKQKELNFDIDNNFIGANYGLPQTGIIIGQEIYRDLDFGGMIKDKPKGITDEILINEGRIRTSNKIKVFGVGKNKTDNKLITDVKSLTDVKAVTLPDSIIDQAQKPGQITDTKLKVTPFLVTGSNTRPVYKQVFEYPQIIEPVIQPIGSLSIPSKRKFKRPDGGLTSTKSVFGKQSFIAQVRKKGKFVPVGVFTSSEQAFSKAKRIVGTSASVSLRVKRLEGGIVNPSGFLSSDFRLSRREEGVLIERRSRRIKSGGELSEITFKGIQSQKNKNFFRRMKI